MSDITLEMPAIEAPKLHTPEEYFRPTAAEAMREALTGSGIGVVDRLGLSELERRKIREELWENGDLHVTNVEADTISVMEFDYAPKTLLNLLQTELQIPDLRIESAALNVYRPAERIAPHIDVPGFLDVLKTMQKLTFIYVVDGRKKFQFWPERSQGPAVEIEQKPDMLMILRAGDFHDVSGEVLPGLQHGVSEQSASCETFVMNLDTPVRLNRPLGAIAVA